MESGCDTVDSMVASDTKGSWFESSHQQLLLNNYIGSTDCRKDKIKKKSPGMARLTTIGHGTVLRTHLMKGIVDICIYTYVGCMGVVGMCVYVGCKVL